MNDDLNLERVSPHDDVECAQGMDRLRRERDQARSIAVALEQECAELERRLMDSRNVAVAAFARLTAHGIALPTRDEIEGAPV